MIKTRMKISIMLLCMLLLSELINSQPFSREFVKNNGQSYTNPFCTIQTRNNNFVHTTGGTNEMTVTRTDIQGNIVWTIILKDFYAFDRLGKYPNVIEDGDGNLMVIGTNYGSGTLTDVSWVKIDGGLGSIMVSGSFEFPNLTTTAFPLDITVTNDGGYAIVGQMSDPTSQRMAGFLIVLDNNAQEVFYKHYFHVMPYFSFPLSDGFTSIIPTNDGGFLIGGITWVQGFGQQVILKTDATGNTMWYRVYNIGYSSETLSDLIEVNNGFVFSTKDCIAMIDYSGIVLWANKYSSPIGFGAEWTIGSLDKSDWGQIIAAGKLNEWITENSPGWLILSDIDGSVNQSYRYKPLINNDNMIRSVQSCSDGGYLMITEKDGSGGTIQLKTNSSGYIGSDCTGEVPVITKDVLDEYSVEITPLENTFYSTVYPIVSTLTDGTMKVVCCPNVAVVTPYIDMNNSDCINNIFQLELNINNGSNSYTYYWTPQSDLNDPTISNPICTPSQTTYYTVFVTDLATGCTSTGTIVVSPGCRLAEPETTLKSNDVFTKMYPNPSNGLVTIETNSPEFNLSVTNTLGEIKYYEKNLNSGKYTFNFSEFSTGIYFLCITQKDGTKNTFKLLIE